MIFPRPHPPAPAIAGLAAVLALVAPALAAPAPAPAAARCDRYAAPNGNNRASGTATAPVRTAQHLVDLLGPGQTGCLRSGTYAGRGRFAYVLRFKHGGSAGAPLTLRSAPGQQATLRGFIYLPHRVNDVTFELLAVDGRAPAGSRQKAVSIQAFGAGITFQSNDITNHGGRTCMILGSNGGFGVAHGTVVRGNTFHSCGDPHNGVLDHAIYLQHTSGAQITDNVITGTSGWAVHLYPNAQGTLVTGNVMWDNGGAVIFAGDRHHTSNGNVVEGNLLGASRRRPELTSSFGGPVGHGNTVQGNCIVPGLGVAGGAGGYTMGANTVVQAVSGCSGALSTATLARAAGVVG